MQYIILVADGMADLPIPELGNKTPLEAADTPHMDFMAQHGVCGLVQTVPEGVAPGSDVANMSILGYDPRKYYTGRGPIEAASLGITLPDDKIAFRCNFVTINNNKMVDFTADHISTEAADQLLKKLQPHLTEIQFYTGVSYRHISFLDPKYLNVSCTPPHDITGKQVDSFLPKGNFSEELISLMNRSAALLANTELNPTQATQIWLWSQGGKPTFPLFYDEFHLTGGIITAVGLLKGLGRLIGFETPDVKGATGFIDTNYQGKVDAAFDLLKTKDFVFLHVEAPDEAGHMGDTALKIRAISDFDHHIVGPILDYQKTHPDLCILILPDHPTPISIKTHTGDPVPFVMTGPDYNKKIQVAFSEKLCYNSDVFMKSGRDLLNSFFNRC